MTDVFYAQAQARGLGEKQCFQLLEQAENASTSEQQLEALLELLAHQHCWKFLAPGMVCGLYEHNYLYLFSELEVSSDPELVRQAWQLLNYGLARFRVHSQIATERKLIDRLVDRDLEPEAEMGKHLTECLDAIMNNGLRHRRYPVTVLLKDYTYSYHYLRNPKLTLCQRPVSKEDIVCDAYQPNPPTLQCPDCQDAGANDPDLHLQHLESKCHQHKRLRELIAPRIAERLQLLLINRGTQTPEQLSELKNQVVTKALQEEVILAVHGQQRLSQRPLSKDVFALPHLPAVEF